MEILQADNCRTCNNVTCSKKRKELICEVFNESVELYKFSTMKYGCESYEKDVKKMMKLPEEYTFDGKKYILWDTQYSEPNAQFACGVMTDRVPKCLPRILKVQEDNKAPVFGVYVKESMVDE